ncbi:hypothetical protein [Frankia sp. CiP3]|uniref:hypothetical protein n=1 Tax=Frankia sp. CiP3 TaxID=2880971 RepID=UPI001EF68FDB|nr:hypothetical protein [Frankia sp. CiP3]
MENLEDAIDQIMPLCEDSHSLYRTAPDGVKQRLNQAVFHRLYILGHTLTGADLHSPLAQLLADDLDVRLAYETQAFVNDIQDPTDTPETDQRDGTPDDSGKQPPVLTGCLPRQRPYGPLPAEKDQPRLITTSRGSNMATLVDADAAVTFHNRRLAHSSV